VHIHVVLMNEGELACRLRSLGIQTSVLPETTLNSFNILIGLVRLMQVFRPDIIHTHRQKENILGNLANVIAFPRASLRPRSIRTVHGAPESSCTGKQKIQVWLDAWVGRRLQRGFIAVSADLAQKLRGNFPSVDIHVVQNGVDTAALSRDLMKADFKLAAPGHRHIGIIGRLESVKRIDIFLEMAAIMLQADLCGHPLQFHIIGDGSLREAMMQRAAKLGLSTHVKFHGHRSDIASCIFSLDVMVMCSDHEGTPMAALEALALGVRLVAHDVGGLHELLSAYPELLVTQHGPRFYANAVARVLTEGSVLPGLDLNYSADNNALRVLRIYRNVAHVGA
jgi:glycosyltransferase involved in cell wall biosynthesis